MVLMAKNYIKIQTGDSCPHCKTGIIIKKRGKYGDFLACDRFPYCAFTQRIQAEVNPLEKQADEFLRQHGVNVKSL